jgi:hypothetical protein
MGGLRSRGICRSTTLSESQTITTLFGRATMRRTRRAILDCGHHVGVWSYPCEADHPRPPGVGARPTRDISRWRCPRRGRRQHPSLRLARTPQSVGVMAPCLRVHRIRDIDEFAAYRSRDTIFAEPGSGLHTDLIEDARTQARIREKTRRRLGRATRQRCDRRAESPWVQRGTHSG